MNPPSLKLIPRRKEVVPSIAVVYSCSEIDTRDNTVLDECVHLNILHAINDKLIGIHVAENLIKNHIQILQNVF